MAEVPLNPNNDKPLSISLSFHLKDVVEINEPQVGCFNYFISSSVKTNKKSVFRCIFPLSLIFGWDGQITDLNITISISSFMKTQYLENLQEAYGNQR